MRTKILYLHIGHYKTGTTALQSMLSLNKRVLMRHDVDYCRSLENYSKHSRLAFSILKAAGTKSLMHGYDLPEPPKTYWAQLYEYVQNSRARRIVVSTEEFARVGILPDAVERLKPLIDMAPAGVEIRVVAYLRPPQEHLKSWYNQLVKMDIRTPDFNTAVSRFIEPVHFDYASMLRPWIEACGAENIILRPYPGYGADGTAIHRDFLDVLGVEGLDLKDLVLPDEDVNPRQHPETLELVRVMQNAEIPREVIDWTEARARKYLEIQSRIVPDINRDFEAVIERSQTGLKMLDTLPESAVSPEEMRAKLPVPDPDRVGEHAELQGFLLNEIYALRRRMNTQMSELYQRVSDLEKQAAGSLSASPEKTSGAPGSSRDS